MAPPF
ncbi:hypothetical protein CGLO_13900 [Colletotrichum gloeosporioides Cg-14]